MIFQIYQMLKKIIKVLKITYARIHLFRSLKKMKNMRKGEKRNNITRSYLKQVFFLNNILFFNGYAVKHNYSLVVKQLNTIKH